MRSLTVMAVLILAAQACTAQDSRESLRRGDEAGGIDTSVVNDRDLFRLEFTLLGTTSESGADSIDAALDKIDGVRGHFTDPANRTCVVYVTDLDRSGAVIAAVRKAGYGVDDRLMMSGPGLTCDIESESEESPSDSTQRIEALDGVAEPLREAFNRSADKIRVLTIPNPSCLACVKGQRFINGLLQGDMATDTGVAAFVIWISIEGWGSLPAARRLAAESADARVLHFWDPDMNVGALFKQPLDLNETYPTAWDVYLVFKPGILWEGDNPPRPTFWMHQLGEPESGVDPSLFLDRETFRSTLNEIRSHVKSAQVAR